MTFYVFIGEVPKNPELISDNNTLGEISFNQFWPSTGFWWLDTVLTAQDSDIDLSTVIIVNDQGKRFTIDAFFDTLSNCVLPKSVKIQR